MSKGYIPAYEILKNGENITAKFQDRCISIIIELMSGNGGQDTCELVLDDRFNMIRSPEVGSSLDISMGYEGVGLCHMGTFQIDLVRYNLVPATITVRGSSIGNLMQAKSMVIDQFENKTVKEILEIAGGKANFKVQVSDEIGKIKIPYLHQTNMSFQHLAGKLEQLTGAVMKFRGNTLTMVKNDGKSSWSDVSLPVYVLQREHFADLETIEDTKTSTSKTVASFTNPLSNLREDVESPSKRGAVGSDSVHRLGNFASKEAAQAAAESAQTVLDRNISKAQGTLSTGDPWLKDSARLLVIKTRPGIDGPYVTDVVRHVLTKGSGIRTSFTALGGEESLPASYQEQPGSSTFLVPLPGQVFGDVLPKLSGTELGQAFGSLPSFALNPPSIPNP